MKHKLRIVVAAALLLSFAACGGDDSSRSSEGSTSSSGGTAAANAEPVRIGMLYPLTGSSATYGRDARNGIELALDLINNPHPGVPYEFAEGRGLPNHGGAPLEVVWADHEGSPEKALTEAERLATTGDIDVMMGAMLSGPTATESQSAERHGIPFLSASATSSELSSRGFKWFFNANTTDELIARDMVRFITETKVKHPEIARVAVIVENSQYGQDAAAAVERNLKGQSGLELVTSLSYERGSQDMSATIQKLKDASPDVVIANTIGEDAITMLNDMVKVDLKLKMLIGRGGFTQKDLLEKNPGLVDNVVTVDFYSPDLMKTKPFVKYLAEEFQKRYGYAMDGTSARDVAGFLVLADALNRAKDFSHEAIRDALAATDLSGKDLPVSWDRVKFDATGQNQDGIPLMLQRAPAGWATIWPDSQKSTDLVYPFPDLASR